MARRERDRSNGIVKRRVGRPRAFTFNKVKERSIVELFLKFCD